MNMRRGPIDLASLAATLTIVAALSGCSDGRPRTYPVTGFVQFSDGKPVRSGTVEFRSTQHRLNARGKIDSTGRFQLGTFGTDDGAVAGMHQAIVTQIVAPPDARRAPRGHQHTTPLSALVAAKHARYETSGLEAEISPHERNEVTLVVERHERP